MTFTLRSGKDSSYLVKTFYHNDKGLNASPLMLEKGGKPVELSFEQTYDGKFKIKDKVAGIYLRAMKQSIMGVDVYMPIFFTGKMPLPPGQKMPEFIDTFDLSGISSDGTLQMEINNHALVGTITPGQPFNPLMFAGDALLKSPTVHNLIVSDSSGKPIVSMEEFKKKSSSHGLSTGAIVGIVIGSIILLILLVLLLRKIKYY
jgi:hypothetical protein